MEKRIKGFDSGLVRFQVAVNRTRVMRFVEALRNNNFRWITADHASVTEFMTNKGIDLLAKRAKSHARSESLSEMYFAMANDCIRYLLCKDLVDWVTENAPEQGPFYFDPHTLQWLPPFGQYAATHWKSHLRIADAGAVSPSVIVLRLMQLDSASMFQISSMELAMTGKFPESRSRYENFLHIVSANGLRRTLFALFAETKGVYSRLSEFCHAQSLLDVPNRGGETPLLLAAEYGDHFIVDRLLLHGAHVSHRNNDGATALYIAALNGHEQVISSLLKFPSSDRDAYHPFSHALGAAVIRGHLGAVRLILTQTNIGAHTMASSFDDGTYSPLATAMQRDDLDMLKLLLTCPKIDQELRGKMADETIMHKASEYTYESGFVFSTVWELVHSGLFPLDARDRYGKTPLAWAVMHQNLRFAHLLLGTGRVNADPMDNYNKTPLYSAIGEKQVEMVKLLLATGQVDVFHKPHDKISPLELAQRKCFGKGDSDSREILAMVEMYALEKRG